MDVLHDDCDHSSYPLPLSGGMEHPPFSSKYLRRRGYEKADGGLCSLKQLVKEEFVHAVDSMVLYDRPEIIRP